MPGDSEHPSEKIRIFDTEPYHLEKYVVPGAVAVALLFLLPWYLLGGNGPSLAGSPETTIIFTPFGIPAGPGPQGALPGLFPMYWD